MNAKETREARRRRIFAIIEIGNLTDWPSRAYDLVNTLAIVVNLLVSILLTFDSLCAAYGALLHALESVTVAFFAVDYVLRLWTAKYLYPGRSQPAAVAHYAFSFTGLVDLLSFLPYYLPFFFPSGAVAFRMFRVMRIFRLFRINAYYDSLNVIAEVIAGKRQQLLSSVFILVTLMLASSLCMYSLEHEAQPEVFANAFSGIWWAVSTLLTVGYGDIYPITPMGRFFSIVITFLGVGMVAIPTGIISAGFVERYSHAKRLSDYAREEDLRFLELRLTARDAWAGKTIAALGLPKATLIAAVRRGDTLLVPRGELKLQGGDLVLLAAQDATPDIHIDLKELTLQKGHPWVGLPIRELDVSRQTFLVLVRRAGRALLPQGDLVLRAGDVVVLYSRTHISRLREED